MAFSASSFTNIDIVASTTETTIVDVTIPANTLTFDGACLDFVIAGVYLNNTGANTNFTPRFYVGGVKVYDDASGNLGTNASLRAVSFVGKVIRRTSTTAEICVNAIVGSAAAATTGRGDFSATSLRTAPMMSTESAAWTFANDTTFQMSIQLSSNSANHYYQSEYYVFSEPNGSFDDAQILNAQTGTTYTLILSDAGRLVTLSNASAITLTVPPNSSAAFPAGTHIDLCQLGAGQVTVSPGSGVTINSRNGTKLAGQYAVGTLIKTGTDTWLLAGDVIV